ncbi:substrate-binding domain-containing protein [Methanobrevibacter sp.]|uniref:substrate-binding domain-containing protein n=1 Tax=Methanobrevibacter sp. TaxID=66852 RepID=UPI00388E6649
MLGIGTVSAFDLGFLSPKQEFKIATTTSLDDTGLLTALEEKFESEHSDVDVQFISAGTGKALEYGEKGDVDLVMVHSKAKEKEFIDAGYGTNRTIFAYNFFYLVGPKDDSAGINGSDVVAAFGKIADEGAKNPDKVKFVSRGDESGTHNRELKIWNETGLDYNSTISGQKWYLESGKGMGETLIMSNEKQAYTLSDSGTYLAFAGNTTLVPYITEGKDLMNVYSLIPINATKFPDTKSDIGQEWITFVTGAEGQGIIKDYGVDKYGKTLFTPYVGTSDPEV